MSNPEASVRSPLTAVVLSLAATGLGQIYCGRIARGLVLFLGSMLFAPAIMLASLLPQATLVLVALMLVLLAVLGVYAFAVTDAFRLARHVGVTFQTQDYNHPLIYTLFILVGLTYSTGGVLLIRANYFEAFVIPGKSDMPTLLPGDRILVNKSTYRRQSVRRGDVVAFRVPSEGAIWVKRVIALPGDSVEVKNEAVFVNGKELVRELAPPVAMEATTHSVQCQQFLETSFGRTYRVLSAPARDPVPDFPLTIVPERSCFVLGDNRNHSRDSRAIGCVAMGDILGEVQYRFWPATAWPRLGILVQ